jgi:hypothetical protein
LTTALGTLLNNLLGRRLFRLAHWVGGFTFVRLHLGRGWRCLVAVLPQGGCTFGFCCDLASTNVVIVGICRGDVFGKLWGFWLNGLVAVNELLKQFRR